MIALLLGVLAAAADTPAAIVRDVEHGQRLDLSNFAGSIRVGVWEQDAVRIVAATHLPGDEVRVVQVGRLIRVRAASWDRESDSLEVFEEGGRLVLVDGKPGAIDYDVSVPGWLPVLLAGARTDVTVEGLVADVTIRLFGGRVVLRRVRGDVSLELLGGSVVLEDIEGGVRARTSRAPVTLRGVRGEVETETAEGNVRVEGEAPRRLRVTTLTGRIDLHGRLADGGRYALGTHSGAIDLRLPAATGAYVRVGRAGGPFHTDFPVELPPAPGWRRATFLLGDGGADLELETFSGEIRLGKEEPAAP
jgi:hypothetical protein